MASFPACCGCGCHGYGGGAKGEGEKGAGVGSAQLECRRRWFNAPSKRVLAVNRTAKLPAAGHGWIYTRCLHWVGFQFHPHPSSYQLLSIAMLLINASAGIRRNRRFGEEIPHILKI